MKKLRALILLSLALLMCGSANLGPIAASRLRSGGGGSGFNAETVAWIAAVDAAGGTYETNSKAIADALIVALRAKSYTAKIVYLLPLLGSNLAAARVPLRDSLAVGIATNHSFVNGDFSQATGLQGDGSTKYLDSLIKPGQLGSSNSGGLGYWESNFASSGNSEVMGNIDSAGTSRYVLDMRAARRFFSWSNAANAANENVAADNADFYGNRANATSRKLYRNGTLLDTNTTSDTATGASDYNILIVGSNDSGSVLPAGSRCAVAYMTDGTLSDADAADLHTLLTDYLITPTGR